LALTISHNEQIDEDAKLQSPLSSKLLPGSKSGFVQIPDACQPAIISHCECMDISLGWKEPRIGIMSHETA
jgi:hypothetical protein